MPVGPRGEKRPSNPNAASIMVARIATGRAEEEYVDGKVPRMPEAPEERIAAMQIAEPKARSKKSKKNRAPRT